MGILSTTNTGAVLGVVVLIAVVNIFLLFARNKKNRKSAKKYKEDHIAAEKRHQKLKNRLEYEQEEAARHVELRKKTLEMYEQVKQQSKNAEDS